MRRSMLLRGLTSASAVMLTFTSVMTNTALGEAALLNSNFNITVDKLVSLDKDTNAIYYESDYGDVNNLTQENLEALLADEEVFVELEMEEGAVLLRNENNALPLSGNERNVTLFGVAAAKPLYKGNSAGGNNDPTREVSLYDALKEEGFHINDTLFDAYLASDTVIIPGLDMRADGAGQEPISFYTDELRNSFAGYGDVALVVINRYGGEFLDLEKVDYASISGLALHQEEIDLLNMINDSGAFEKVVLINNSAYPLELEYMDEYHIDACLWIGTPGLVGYRGVVDLLIGNANPSGRLIDTYAADSLSAPATQNFGDFTYSNAEEIAAVCTDAEKNTTHYVMYQEGIYVGYKYYETRYEDCVLGQGGADSTAGTFASKGAWNYADEVVFPFGYGLSYTTFKQTLDNVAEENGIITVQATVTNTGNTAGKSVVQVYVQTPYTDYDRENLVEKSAIQLAGFEKTKLLEPGESETVTVTIDKYLIASYDYINAKGYILDAGDYYLAIGEDAHDALNNVLAAKGASDLYDQDGNQVIGDIAKTHCWTQETLDTESYRYSSATGAEVTNQFDNVDLNYWIDNGVTYLTRQNWKETFPAPLNELAATDTMIKEIDGYLYETPANAPSVSEFTQGADNGIGLVSMHGLDYDDPKWEQFLDQLTLEDMTRTIDEVWGNVAIKNVYKPENRSQDGPGGVCGPYFPEESRESASVLTGVKGSGTAYVGQAVAASQWNKDMIAKRGYFLAEDALFCNVSELWSPGANIHRTPFSGRNFEYYSEDGTLSYLLSAEQVKAMQDKGLCAALKHFVLNDAETNRMGVSTFCNEQAMREIYLKSFEGAFVIGGATGTMTSFNRLGCTYAGHSSALQRDVLRGEWGFKGATISDSASKTYMHAIEGLVGGTDIWALGRKIIRGPQVKEYIETHDDGNLYQILRESQHGFYYKLANGSLINGLTENMEYQYAMPWWQAALYTAIAVFGAATATLAALYAKNTYGKKRKSEKEVKA